MVNWLGLGSFRGHDPEDYKHRSDPKTELKNYPNSPYRLTLILFISCSQKRKKRLNQKSYFDHNPCHWIGINI